jgi:hypothetical protein
MKMHIDSRQQIISNGLHKAGIKGSEERVDVLGGLIQHIGRRLDKGHKVFIHVNDVRFLGLRIEGSVKASLIIIGIMGIIGSMGSLMIVGNMIKHTWIPIGGVCYTSLGITFNKRRMQMSVSIGAKLPMRMVVPIHEIRLTIRVNHRDVWFPLSPLSGEPSDPLARKLAPDSSVSGGVSSTGTASVEVSGETSSTLSLSTSSRIGLTSGIVPISPLADESMGLNGPSGMRTTFQT